MNTQSQDQALALARTQVKEALARAGGVAVVAAHFGISPVSVYEWIKRGFVAAERCPLIEEFSNGAARCEDLNANVNWGYLRQSQVAVPVISPRRATDPISDPGHAGRQPPSTNNIFDSVPDHSVVLPSISPSTEAKE